MPFHLTKNQRIELSLLIQLNYSQRRAAAVLGVSPSTVSRELRRNLSVVRKTYHAAVAERLRRMRRESANQAKRKLVVGSMLVELITSKLTRQQWSPEQIPSGSSNELRSLLPGGLTSDQ